MDFFNNPKQVTLVVFFAETILALLNMKHFIYLGADSLMVLPILALIPFIFYYIYAYILDGMERDLKPTSKEQEKVFVKWKKDNAADASEKERDKEDAENVISKRADRHKQDVAGKGSKQIQVLDADTVFEDDRLSDTSSESSLDTESK